LFSKLSKSVGDVLEFPPDVTGDVPRITLNGREQVIIENYLGITDFTEREIGLQTALGRLIIVGKDLRLNVILPTELRIEGEIRALEFREEQAHV